MESLRHFFYKNPGLKSRPSVKVGRPGQQRTKQPEGIDFYAYGGDYNDDWAGFQRKMREKGGFGDKGDSSSREAFQRAAEQLGIKKVDSENDIFKIRDAVFGQGSFANNQSQEPAAQPKQEAGPVVNNPGPDVKAAQAAYNAGRQGGMTFGGGSPRMKMTDDPYADALNYGADLNDYGQAAFDNMENKAKLIGTEIGDSSRFHINRFAFEIPQLTNIRDTFAYYRDQIENA